VSPAKITLPERYRVIRHLANGGMASVWEAHDQMLDRAVAVKLLAPHLSEDPRGRERFQREARAAAGLSSHPHVVTIYDVGEHDGRTFMVMELMRGGSVADRLRAGEEISDDTALRWLREAAGALDAAHDAGIVHRDVKPANLLLDERDRLAIGDFGIARVAMEDQLTATGQVLGTAAYISPEQAVGRPATAASDRYALAVVAYELLTGAKPFEAEHFAAQARAHVEDPPPLASERRADLPELVDAVLARGLAKEPDERWPSATKLVRELCRALEAPPTEPTRRMEPVAAAASPPPPTRNGDGDGFMPARSRGRRFPTGLAVFAAIAALLLAAALAAALVSGGDDPEQASEPRSTPTAEATKEPTREPTAEPTEEPTAEPTAEATEDPAPAEEPEPSNEPNLEKAGSLQVEGFNANRAGDYDGGLKASQKALKACGDTQQLNPCGYAAYEVGYALNRLGRNEEAIPYLEQRLAYGDNSSGEVQRELNRARSGG
jgi:serine/threonine-protein kinase